MSAGGYPPDAETNILFTGETAKTARPVVRAGTLEKLIQRLTWEAYPGTSLGPASFELLLLYIIVRNNC